MQRMTCITVLRRKKLKSVLRKNRQFSKILQLNLPILTENTHGKNTVILS